MTEILPLSNGYKAIVETDNFPSNPWQEWDCNPPILVFNLDRHHGKLEDYGTGLSMADVLRSIPDRRYGPKLRGEILAAAGLEAEDCHYYLDNPRKSNGSDWKDAILNAFDSDPSSWTAAREHFEGLEYLCGLAGIPCKWEQSTGYSQGDAAWVFVAATPEWVKDVGWGARTPEDKSASLQADLDLWTAWAWGDVYGYSNLIRPDGTETEDSCWGFYGDDHEKSGLIEMATNAAECDIFALAKEEARRFEAACRDIITA